MKETCRFFFKKCNAMPWFFRAVLLFVLIFPLFAGCSDNALKSISDEDSNESQLEEAAIALDKGNYEKALSILDSMNPENATVKEYAGSAWAGMANLDLFSFLKLVETINESDGDSTLEAIGKALGPEGNNIFTSDKINEKLGYLNNSIYTLLGQYEYVDKNVLTIKSLTEITLDDVISAFEDLEDNISVHLGIVGLAHAVMTISRIICDDLELDSITVSEGVLRDLYQGTQGELRDTDTLNAFLEDITIDLNIINNSIDVILATAGVSEEKSNDIQEALDEFIDKIDSNGDLTVTKDELEAYLKSLK